LAFHVAAHLQQMPGIDMISLYKLDDSTCFAFRLIAMLIVSNYKHPGRPTSGFARPCSRRLHVEAAAPTFFNLFREVTIRGKPLID